MAEEATQPEKQTVSINGEEHNVADLSQEQIGLLNQVVDLDNKIRPILFNLAQANGGRSYFMSLLTASLNTEEKPDEDAVTMSD
jgi:hypothetical protein